MNLSVKDVAEILTISKKTVYRMIKNETIPCFRVGGQWRFDRTEIASWLEDMRSFHLQSTTSETSSLEESISLSDLIRRGGIYDGIPGGTKAEVILGCIKLIKTVIPTFDEEELFQSIMNREALCPTSVGHGVAFPHPKSFGKFVSQSHIALCRLDRAIPFGSLDNEDIDILFFIFPTSERRFLRIHAKLVRLLRDEHVLSAIKGRQPSQNILKIIAVKEPEIFGHVLNVH
jgi:PTS system nitrogen regulatory IIA component